MMGKFLCALGLLGVLLAGPCGASAEEVKIEGGGAAISAIFLPLHDSFEDATGIEMTAFMSTPVKGLIALENGAVDVAAASVPLEEMIAGAAKLKIPIDPATLQTFVVGMNRTLVYTNKSNRIKALTKEQLKGIFTGKIVNWKEIGGKDLPVQVVWGTGTPGQNALFTRVILDGEPVTGKATMVNDYNSIRDAVMATPGAVGIDPHGMKTAVINSPSIPELKSSIIMVTKGAPSPKVRKLIDHINSTLSSLN